MGTRGNGMYRGYIISKAFVSFARPSSVFHPIPKNLSNIPPPFPRPLPNEGKERGTFGRSVRIPPLSLSLSGKGTTCFHSYPFPFPRTYYTKPRFFLLVPLRRSLEVRTIGSDLGYPMGNGKDRGIGRRRGGRGNRGTSTDPFSFSRNGSKTRAVRPFTHRPFLPSILSSSVIGKLPGFDPFRNHGFLSTSHPILLKKMDWK